MEEDKKPEDVIINIKPDDCKIDVTFQFNSPEEEEK